MSGRKKISICGGAFNEGENIQALYEQVLLQLKKCPQYDYEFIIADNKSTPIILGRLVPAITLICRVAAMR